VAVGDALPTLTFDLQRGSMVAYANASGDQNPIHQDEAFAKQVGLPDVIAHGMLTMGMAASVVTEWVEDPAAVVSYGVRFTRPIVVPAGQTVVLEVSGVIRSIDEQSGIVGVDLTAAVGGETVLARARVEVRLHD
jgi:acyl dehydratase